MLRMKTVAYSLSDLGEVWNDTHDRESFVRMNTHKTEKAHKCHICGAEMKRIYGTNVYVCYGMIEVPKPTENNPDAKELKPCTNYTLSRQ